MNFYKTTAAFGVTACLLMATSAYGATSLPASDTFESTQGGWLGDVSLTESQTVTVPDPAGLPITTASGASVSTTVLTVSGSATNSYENASSNPFVDMMVKVSVPDEALSALATGAGGDAEGAKFAVAVDAVANETTGQFKYWNGSQWTPLSTEQFAAGAWVRVTMKFDYGTTAKTCTVALNGNTCGTYPLIDNTASSLASVQIKGDTAIDEVLVAQGSVPAFADQTAVVATGCLATKAWFTKNDVTWPTSPSQEQIAALSSQYVFGLAPDTNATTAATLPLSFVQDATTGKATLSFPGLGAYGGAGTYVLQSKTTGEWSGDTVVAAGASGVTTTQVNLPSTLTYYRIVPTAPAAPASGN